MFHIHQELTNLAQTSPRKKSIACGLFTDYYNLTFLICLNLLKRKKTANKPYSISTPAFVIFLLENIEL